MNIFDFFNHVCGIDMSTPQNKKVVEFCQNLGLIPKEMLCPKCLSLMNLGESTSLLDEVVWRCSGSIKLHKKRPAIAIIQNQFEKILYLQDLNYQLSRYC